MEIRLPLAVGAVALLAFGGFTGDSADGDRLTCAQAQQIESVAELPDDERVAIERFRRRCAGATGESTAADDGVDDIATRPVADTDPTNDQPAGEPDAEPPAAPVADGPVAEKPPAVEPPAEGPDDASPDDGLVLDPTGEEPCAVTPVGDPTVDEPGVGEPGVGEPGVVEAPTVMSPVVMPPVAMPPVAVPPPAFASAVSPVVDDAGVGGPASAAQAPAPTVGACPPPADQDEGAEDETGEDETGEDETGEDETGEDETIEDGTIEDGTIEDGTIDDGTIDDEGAIVGGETTESNVTTEGEVVAEIDDVVITGEEPGPATVVQGAAAADVAGEEEPLVGATGQDGFAGPDTFQPLSVGTSSPDVIDSTGTQTTDCAAPSATPCAETTPVAAGE